MVSIQRIFPDSRTLVSDMEKNYELLLLTLIYPDYVQMDWEETWRFTLLTHTLAILGRGSFFCIWQWWKLYKPFHVLILLSHIYIYTYTYRTWCKGYRGSLKTYSSIHVFSQVTEQLLSHIGRNKNQKYHLQRSSAQGTDEKKQRSKLF